MLTAHVQGRLEAEKARIARRLHGDVAGMLAAARMDLSRLAGAQAQDAGLGEQFARVDQILAAVIQNAQSEMQRLHPALLDHFGLSAALRHLVEDTCRAGGAVYALELPDFADARVSAPVALAAYRAVEAWLEDGALVHVTMSLREKSPHLVLQAQVERSESLSSGPSNDLLALRAWLETLDVAWTESGHGSTRSVQLVLPLQPAATPSTAMRS